MLPEMTRGVLLPTGDGWKIGSSELLQNIMHRYMHYLTPNLTHGYASASVTVSDNTRLASG